VIPCSRVAAFALLVCGVPETVVMIAAFCNFLASE
jgi:hypothetical protein